MVVFSWIFLQESRLQGSLPLARLQGPLQRPPSPQVTASQWHAYWGLLNLAVSTQCGSPLTATSAGQAETQSDQHLQQNLFLHSPLLSQHSDRAWHPKQSPLPRLLLTCTGITYNKSLYSCLHLGICFPKDSNWHRNWQDYSKSRKWKRVEKRGKHVSHEQKRGLMAKSPHALSSTPVLCSPWRSYTH